MLLQASFYSSNRIINIPCSCYRPVSLPTFTGCATAAYRETQRRTHSTRGESGVKKQWNERPDFIHLSIRLLNGRSCSHDDDGDVMRVEEKRTHCCCCWYFADPREFSHKFQSLSDTLSTCCTTICNNVPNRYGMFISPHIRNYWWQRLCDSHLFIHSKKIQDSGVEWRWIRRRKK